MFEATAKVLAAADCPVIVYHDTGVLRSVTAALLRCPSCSTAVSYTHLTLPTIYSV